MNQTHEQLKASPRSFPEDYHLENGNYMCKCVSCEEYFVGYKRRCTCKLCQRTEPIDPTTCDMEVINKIFENAGM